MTRQRCIQHMVSPCYVFVSLSLTQTPPCVSHHPVVVVIIVIVSIIAINDTMFASSSELSTHAMCVSAVTITMGNSSVYKHAHTHTHAQWVTRLCTNIHTALSTTGTTPMARAISDSGDDNRYTLQRSGRHTHTHTGERWWRTHVNTHGSKDDAAAWAEHIHSSVENTLNIVYPTTVTHY